MKRLRGTAVRRLRVGSRPAHRASRHRGVRAARRATIVTDGRLAYDTLVRLAESCGSIKGYSRDQGTGGRRVAGRGSSARRRRHRTSGPVGRRNPPGDQAAPFRRRRDMARRNSTPCSTRPQGVRPTRVAASTAHRRRTTACWPRIRVVHLGVVEAWFDDPAHLHRFESGHVDGIHGSTVVSAEAVVLRGAGWLERRWLDDRPGSSTWRWRSGPAASAPIEFSERWRDHAGRARSSTG